MGIGAVMPARKGGDEQGASVEFRMYIENTFLTDGIFLFPAPIVVMSQSVVKRFNCRPAAGSGGLIGAPT